MIATDDRYLNDRLRLSQMGSRRIQLSPEIIALGRSRVAEILLAIRRFRTFLEFIDYDGDHSRGELEVAGRTVRFEIKTYPRFELGFHGERTDHKPVRVLTVSLNSEADHEH